MNYYRVVLPIGHPFNTEGGADEPITLGVFGSETEALSKSEEWFRTANEWVELDPEDGLTECMKSIVLEVLDNVPAGMTPGKLPDSDDCWPLDGPFGFD